jgi:methylmalonyl-CoA mutase C-terminal domain/subunit
MADRKQQTEKLRILLAKPGLDGHDRGIKVVARTLRDAGHEVIYAGLRQTPEMVVAAASQEDVDLIGLSILSGAHMTLFPAVLQGLRDHGMGDVPVFGGGIIPAEDAKVLLDMGVAAIFTPGTPLEDITRWVQQFGAAHAA